MVATPSSASFRDDRWTEAGATSPELTSLATVFNNQSLPTQLAELNALEQVGNGMIAAALTAMRSANAYGLYLGTGIGSYGPALFTSGGTMTGPLITARDPLGALEVANKEYVDAAGPGYPSYGMTPANFPIYRKAKANAYANTGPGKILCIGTSITAGQPSTVNAGLYSMPAYLAQILNKSVPTQLTLAACNVSINNDARWSIGSGWTQSPSGGIGWANWGYVKSTTIPTTGPLAYTPGVPLGNVDTFDVYYAGTNLTGNMSWAVNGGSYTAFSTNHTPNGIYVHSNGVTRGTGNSLQLEVLTGLGAFPVAVDAYDSTQAGLRIGNAGVPLLGTAAAWSNQNGISSLDCIKAWAPSLVIIEINADDALNTGGIPALATFTANLQTVITWCKAIPADVLLWTMPTGNPAGSATQAQLAAEATFNQVNLSLAASNNCGAVDIGSRFGPFSTWGTANGFNYDNVHPNNLGYADIATAIAGALAKAA